MAQILVYNEQLDGAVDGVNKTFTCQYPVLYTESLRVGGVEYASFSVNGNVLTLADAPTVEFGSPYFDYVYDDGTTPETVTEVNFEDVVDEAYLKLGQTRASRQFPLALVENYVKEGLIIVNNQRTNPRLKVGSYNFNKAPDCYVESYSATEIPVGYVPPYASTQGMVMVNATAVVKYNTVTSSAFGSLSGLDFEYFVKDKVSIGYRLPSKVKKVSEVIMNGKPLYYSDSREYSLKANTGLAYTIVYDGGVGYLFLPFSQNSEQIVTVKYVKENANYANGITIDIEQDYKGLPALYACWNLCRDREDQRYDIFKADYEILLKKYKAYLRTVFGINTRIPSSGFKRLSVYR